MAGSEVRNPGTKLDDRGSIEAAMSVAMLGLDPAYSRTVTQALLQS